MKILFSKKADQSSGMVMIISHPANQFKQNNKISGEILVNETNVVELINENLIDYFLK